MIEFLSLHAADIIISLIVTAAVAAAAVKVYRDRKKGACSGCSDCSGCCGKTGCCGCSEKTENP